ncbi:MAG TPA: hypothetical protein VKB08_04360, partial [Bradyrhizobium sp.]|nr:hypothetical protein [Bradyrhizobium sp.]
FAALNTGIAGGLRHAWAVLSIDPRTTPAFSHRPSKQVVYRRMLVFVLAGEKSASSSRSPSLITE